MVSRYSTLVSPKEISTPNRSFICLRSTSRYTSPMEWIRISLRASTNSVWISGSSSASAVRQSSTRCRSSPGPGITLQA